MKWFDGRVSLFVFAWLVLQDLPLLLLSFIRARLAERLTRIYCVGGRGQHACVWECLVGGSGLGCSGAASRQDARYRFLLGLRTGQSAPITFESQPFPCALNLPRKKDSNLKHPDTTLVFPASFFQFFYPFLLYCQWEFCRIQGNKHMNSRTTTQEFQTWSNCHKFAG